MGIFQIHKEGKPLKVEGVWLKEKKKKKVKSVSLSVRVKGRIEKETGIGCK